MYNRTSLRNGTKDEWTNASGQVHRDDGPAVIYNRTTGRGMHKLYYRAGILHRDDGPARIWYDGTEEWFQHALLHRDDGPAVVKDKAELYYKVGLLHREGGEPAVVKLTDGVRLEWLVNGIKHRPEKDWRGRSLPAIKHSKDRVVIKERFLIDGRLHRDDGPAKVDRTLKNTIKNEEWYKDGHLHSYNDLPAKIDRMGTKSWYKDGTLHRDGLPAKVLADGSEQWYCNGRQHRDGDQPSVTDVRMNRLKYHKDGRLHRIGGPAVVYTDKDDYAYYQEGRLHSEGDIPSLYVTNTRGNMTTEKWHVRGHLHREGSPAVITRSIKGDEKSYLYYRNDIRHRNDGPGEIYFTDGEIVNQLWWWKGRSYRFRRWSTLTDCDEETKTLLILRYG